MKMKKSICATTLLLFIIVLGFAACSIELYPDEIHEYQAEARPYESQPDETRQDEQDEQDEQEEFPSEEEQLEEPSYHPFAKALAEFFVNLAPAPIPDDDNWMLMPVSSYAILVDLDGNGNMGMLASAWKHYDAYSSRFEQYLFWIQDGELRSECALWPRFGITPAKRLVGMDQADMSNYSEFWYTLLDFVDDELSFIKTISVGEAWSFTGEEGNSPIQIDETSFFMRTYINGDPWRSWYREWGYVESITHDEFESFMTMYGLHDATTKLWEFPDETEAILN